MKVGGWALGGGVLGRGRACRDPTPKGGRRGFPPTCGGLWAGGVNQATQKQKSRRWPPCREAVCPAGWRVSSRAWKPERLAATT